MDRRMFQFLMKAGSWKTIFTRTNDSFRYRQAASDDNILLPEKNGRAVINTIYGNTVKWNQLSNESGYFGGQCKSFTITNHVFSIISKSNGNAYVALANITIAGHKYFALFNYKAENENARLVFGDGSTYTIQHNTSWTPYLRIYTASDATFRIGFTFTNQQEGLSGELQNVNVLDLTLLGIDNLTTPEEVEAWLALNVGTQDYYPYDAGSLVSFKGKGVKSVGFNKWDEEWELGDINSTTGANKSGSVTIRSKNYIKCFPNTVYYFKAPVKESTSVRVFYYDANKNFISSPSYFYSNTTKTTPEGVYYMRFAVIGTTYNNDICININDTAKNGTYKPYTEDILNLDVTKIYGKINGEGNRYQCYPNGMRRADSVSDELSVEQAVVKIGSVDMGDGSWTLHTSGNMYAENLTIGRKVNGNLVCAKYTYVGEISDVSTLTDNNSIATQTQLPGRIVVRDTAYSTAEAFETAVTGVKLFYELATPITYTDLIYSEDGGVTGTPLKELIYKVDKYSTEELLVPASVSGEPTSTAIIADINYQKK